MLRACPHSCVVRRTKGSSLGRIYLAVVVVPVLELPPPPPPPPDDVAIVATLPPPVLAPPPPTPATAPLAEYGTMVVGLFNCTKRVAKKCIKSVCMCGSRSRQMVHINLQSTGARTEGNSSNGRLAAERTLCQVGKVRWDRIEI